MRSPRSFRRATAVATALLALAWLVPSAPAAAASAAPTIWVRGTLGSCDYNGFAGGAGNVIVVRHRKADGTLRKKHTVEIQPGGLWSVACPGPTLASGDELRVYSESGQTLYYTLTIPALNLVLDRVGNVVKGRFPGGADEVWLDRGFCDVATFVCDLQKQDELTAPDGDTFDLVGPVDAADWAVLEWWRGGDRIQRVSSAARLVVKPGTSKVQAMGGTFGKQVFVTLKRGAKIGRGSAKIGPDRFAKVTIRRNGAPMSIKVGDVISASVASDAKLTVPPFNLYPTEDAINGRCFKGGSVAYRITSGAGQVLSEGTTTGDPGFGTWSHPEANLQSGNKVAAWCANAKGDVLELHITLP
jgi:hypothetical protein